MPKQFGIKIKQNITNILWREKKGLLFFCDISFNFFCNKEKKTQQYNTNHGILFFFQFHAIYKNRNTRFFFARDFMQTSDLLLSLFIIIINFRNFLLKVFINKISTIFSKHLVISLTCKNLNIVISTLGAGPLSAIGYTNKGYVNNFSCN